MGEVYKGFDLEQKIIVAIKVLNRQQDGDEEKAINTVRRFKREASALQSLSHNNIVKIYRTGRKNRNNYIVMEYVEGGDLQRHIKKNGKIHQSRAIKIIIQVCLALQEAHNKGILHRDIKPGNILMGKNGETKLTDFSICRKEKSKEQLTKTGEIIGTIAYISPEQLAGKATKSSDIYSLGITLYEMVTGELPFSGANAINVLSKHVNEDIPDPHKKNKEINQHLSEAIKKMTKKNPEDRHANINELYVELKKILRIISEEDVKTRKLKKAWLSFWR